MVNKRKKGRRGGYGITVQKKNTELHIRVNEPRERSGHKNQNQKQKSEHTYAQGTNEGVTDWPA